MIKAPCGEYPLVEIFYEAVNGDMPRLFVFESDNLS